MPNTLHPLSIFKREFLARTLDTFETRAAVTVEAQVLQRDAVELMRVQRSGSVVVLRNENGDKQIAGIVTERDVVTRWSKPAFDRSASIEALMTPNPQTLKHNASIARLVHTMAGGGYRHVPVLHGAGKPIQMISSKDLVDMIHKRLTSKILTPDNAVWLDDNLVDQFFGSRIDVLSYDPPLTLSSSKMAADALSLMRDNKKGAVVTVDHNHTINGIFTERDYVAKVALSQQAQEKILLAEVLTPKPRTLPLSASVAVAFGLLSEGGYRHIPLVDEEEKFVGILSVRNFLSYLSASILKTLADKQK